MNSLLFYIISLVVVCVFLVLIVAFIYGAKDGSMRRRSKLHGIVKDGQDSMSLLHKQQMMEIQRRGVSTKMPRFKR